ncbi:MAG: hypothetical protein GWO24_11415, partial [Akkermansiaceae bacterium]|nr:hypothetical protein [Akkermansiaceae bacterium]
MAGKATKDATASKITVPDVTMNELEFRIVGISPLMVNQFPEKAMREMEDKGKGVKTKRPPRNPKESFNAARYQGVKYKPAKGRAITADGFRADGIKKAVVSAAKFLDGVFMTTLRGSLFVNLGEELVPIMNGKGACKPEMDRRPVRLAGPSRTADIRYRPIYHDWSIPVKVLFDPSLIDEVSIVRLFTRAGISVGIGENRPEKGGQYGMFRPETA